MEAGEERRHELRRDEDVAVRKDATPRSRLWLASVGCVIGLALFASLQINACAREKAIDSERYTVCREGNLPNAYIRLVLERSGFKPARFKLPLPSNVLPILACRKTVDAGHPVRLTPREERRYLDVFARGRLPVVSHGHVVGSETIPTASR